MITCNFGYYALFKYLVQKGAKLDLRDNTGFSALTYSVKMEKVPFALYLVAKGADVRVRDENGCSLLH